MTTSADEKKRMTPRIAYFSIAINASFFNSQRMLSEYMMRAYQGEE